MFVPTEKKQEWEEAAFMVQESVSIKDAFLSYAKEKTNISPSALIEGLSKISDFCHLKQQLLEITDVKSVRKVQQQVAEGKLLHFRFGKEATRLREISQLYYSFIKCYHPPRKQGDSLAMSSSKDDFSLPHESVKPASGAPLANQYDNDVADEDVNSSDLHGFGEWMIDQGMAERSSHGYISSLLTIQRFKCEHSIGEIDIIGTKDPRKLQDAIDELLEAPLFVEYNKRQHYRFLASLKKYKQYLAFLNGIVAKPENEINALDSLDYQLSLIIDTLANKFRNGFTFTDNALRLLAEESGIEVSRKLQEELKKKMIKREDDTWYLIEQIASVEVLEAIAHEASVALEECRFFEVEMLLSEKREYISESIIRNADDFEILLFAIIRKDIRSIRTATKHIIKLYGSAKEELYSDLANRIVGLIHNEYGGVAGEDDIALAFPLISAELIQYIIKEYAEDLVRIEINDTVCYQTLDALGLPDDFSQTLEHVLTEFDELGIEPSSENIHTVLAIYTRINIRRDFGLTDDKTFRRLVSIYDTSNNHRKWKAGKYRGEDD